jgi:hypothetical protein
MLRDKVHARSFQIIRQFFRATLEAEKLRRDMTQIILTCKLLSLDTKIVNRARNTLAVRKKMVESMRLKYFMRYDLLKKREDHPFKPLMETRAEHIDACMETCLVVIYHILLRQFLVKRASVILRKSFRKLSKTSFEDFNSTSLRGDVSAENSRSRVPSPKPVSAGETAVGLNALAVMGNAMRAQSTIIEDGGIFANPNFNPVMLALQESSGYSLMKVSRFKSVQRSIYNMENCRLVVTTMKAFNDDTGLSIETAPELKPIKQKVKISFKKSATRTLVDDEAALKEQLRNIKTIGELGNKLKERAKFDYELRDAFLDRMIFAVCKELTEE